MPQTLTFKDSDFESAPTVTFKDSDFETPAQKPSPVIRTMLPSAAAQNRQFTQRTPYNRPAPASVSPYEASGVGSAIGAVADVISPETGIAFAPARAAKEEIDRQAQEFESGFSPEDPMYAVAAGAAEAKRRAQQVTTDIILDPTNLLPLGTLMKGARWGLRLAADALFIGLAETGAIKAFREGRYDDAAVQQAFALVGLSGAAGLRQEAVIKETAKRTAEKTANDRTQTQIAADTAQYNKWTETQGKASRRAEAQTRPNQAARRASIEVPETTAVEDPTLRFSDEELDALTRPDAPVEQPPLQSTPVEAVSTTDRVTLPGAAEKTTIDSTPPIVEQVARPEADQADMLEQLTTPETEVIVPETIQPDGESIDAYLTKASPEQRRDLLGDEGALLFEQGESKPLLGKTAEEATTMTAAGRRPEQLKEGKIFDETALVESELFQGKGGPQHDLSEADLSFDFGENIKDRIDNFETRQKEELSKLWKSAGKGETLGANLPVEVAARLAAIGAAKVAKGVIKFGEWSAAMVKEFGEEIRPHLRSLYNMALERAAELRKLEADDYFNFKRVDISDAEKQALRGEVIGVVLETGRIPKERESWQTIRDEAQRMGGSELTSELDTARNRQPELRAVRHAARQRINTINKEISDARQKAADLRGDDAFAAEQALLTKEKDLRGLLDVWMRMRSEDGRNLAMHRMMADSTWDATYWLSRAKRAMGVPAGAELPVPVQREIGEIITAGDRAAQRAEAAKKKLVDRGVLAAGGSVRDLPELTGPIETLKGVQKDIQDYRAGLDEVNQQKIKLARKMKNLDRSGWLETIIALRNVGLLTGIKTHLRNIGGNMSFQVLEELQRVPAATVDMLLSLKTGQRTVQGANPKAMVAALQEARTKGVKAAKQVMREGASVDELGKVELHRELNSGVKWLDSYARFIVRTMSAEDRIFKSYAYRRSLEEQAVLSAKNGGTSVLETLRNPSETMIQQAIYDAEFSTFNNPNILAQGLRSMQGRWRNEGGTAGRVASAATDLAVPFKNTPANIIARVFDYAGGGFVKSGFHAFNAMAQKGMTPAMQKAISQGMGRGMTGAALITLGYSLAQKGIMTGVQETDPAKQNVAQAAGRLPGSIQVAGRWHQVAPFSPGGNLMTIGATIQRESTKALRDEASRPGNIAAIATRTALDQPMLKGLSDVVEAANNPAAAGERWTSTTIGSFVPTLIADSAALFDPYMRDARTDSFIESLYKGFQNRTPGWRNLLPVRRDVLGEPTQEPSMVAVNPMISPKAKELTDPAIQKIIATETSVGFPRRDPGEGRDSYSLRAQLVGREIKRRVGAIEFDPSATVEQKRRQVKIAVDGARDRISQIVQPLKALPETERVARLKVLIGQ